MRITGCLVLLALTVASSLAGPTPKIVEKKSLADSVKLDEKEEPRIEEDAGSEKDRAKKSTASFCVHVRPENSQLVQVPCDCKSQQEPLPRPSGPLPQRPTPPPGYRIVPYLEPIYQPAETYGKPQESQKRPSVVVTQNSAPSKLIALNVMEPVQKPHAAEHEKPVTLMEMMNAQQASKQYGPMAIYPPNRLVYLTNDGNVRNIYQTTPYETAYNRKQEATAGSPMMNQWNGNTLAYRNLLPLSSNLVEQQGPQSRNADNEDSYEPQGRTTIVSVKGGDAPRPVIYQPAPYATLYPEMSLNLNPYPAKVYTHEFQVPTAIKTSTYYMRDAHHEADSPKMVYRPDASSQIGVQLNTNAPFKMASDSIVMPVANGKLSRDREAIARFAEKEQEVKETKDEKKAPVEKPAR